MQTSTHGLTIGEREVRKEFVAEHEAQAEREWACLTLLAEHAPGLAPRPLRREDGETPGDRDGAAPGGAARPATADDRADGGARRQRCAGCTTYRSRRCAAAGIGPRRYGARRARAGHARRVAGRRAYDLAECRDPALVGEALEVARAVSSPRRRCPSRGSPPSGSPTSTRPTSCGTGGSCGWSTSRTAASATRRTSSRTTSSTSAAACPACTTPTQLADAVGLDAEDRERMAAYRPLWAAFWLAMLLPGNGSWRRNPRGHHRGPGRAFHGSRAPPTRLARRRRAHGPAHGSP